MNTNRTHGWVCRLGTVLLAYEVTFSNGHAVIGLPSSIHCGDRLHVLSGLVIWKVRHAAVPMWTCRHS